MQREDLKEKPMKEDYLNFRFVDEVNLFMFFKFLLLHRYPHLVGEETRGIYEQGVWIISNYQPFVWQISTFDFWSGCWETIKFPIRFS